MPASERLVQNRQATIRELERAIARSAGRDLGLLGNGGGELDGAEGKRPSIERSSRFDVRKVGLHSFTSYAPRRRLTFGLSCRVDQLLDEFAANCDFSAKDGSFALRLGLSLQADVASLQSASLPSSPIHAEPIAPFFATSSLLSRLSKPR